MNVSTSEAAREISSTSAFSYSWIFARRADLLVAIGGMLSGFGLLGLHHLAGIDMLVIWFVWVITLDTPHFFATYTRTYLDREARKEHRFLLRASLLIFALVPLALLTSALLHGIGVDAYRLPWTLLESFIGIWAYTHITRQHYGFLRLYNRKNCETGSRQAWFDGWVLYLFLAFSFFGVLDHYGIMIHLFGLSASSSTTINDIAFLAAILIAAVFYLYQLGRFFKGLAVNLPKLIFLSTVLLLHGVVSFTDVLPTSTIFAFIAVITIYHDIQYLYFVQFQGQGRYGKVSQPERIFGIAGRLSKHFLLLWGTALLVMSIPVWGFACAIGYVPFCQGDALPGTPTFIGLTNWTLAFVVILTGVQMHHYVLDMFIWRPSKSARLRQELNVGSTA